MPIACLVLPRPPRRTRFVVAVALLVWSSVVAFGFSYAWRYAYTPGRPANAKVAWPRSTQLQRRFGLPTIVMVLHPECDCSRASLVELAQVLARASRPVETFAIVERIDGAGEPAQQD